MLARPAASADLGHLLVVLRGAAPLAAPVVPAPDAGHGRLEIRVAGAVRDEPRRPVRPRRRDALVRCPGVQLGTAVGQQVVALGYALVPGPRQVAVGGEHRGPVGEHRPGQRVTLRAGDERAADPGHAALDPAPVGHRDEHPVGGRRGLRLDHLGGPFPLGPAVARPVHRGRDEVGAVQGSQPRPLRELQVVADHHGHPPDLGVHRRQRGVAGGEDELLRIPQVRLAVDRAGAGRVDQGRAVVQAAVVAEFAEAADDHQAMLAGQGVPLRAGSGCPPRARPAREPRRPGPRRRRRNPSRIARAAPRAARPRRRPRLPPAAAAWRLASGSATAIASWATAILVGSTMRTPFARDRTMETASLMSSSGRRGGP